jgi:hypothetical protein
VGLCSNGRPVDFPTPGGTMNDAEEQERQPTPQEVWDAYVDTLTWQKHHLDQSSWSAFLRGGSLKISAEQVLKEVQQRIEAAGDSPKAAKLERQIRRAYEHVGTHAGTVTASGVSPKKKRTKSGKLTYESDKLQKVAANLTGDVTLKWLTSVSPLSTRSRSPAGFLHQLYKQGEYVLVFDVFESQGDLWEHKGAIANLSVNYLQRRHQNVWYASQPVDGQFHWNPREQKQSRRSEESVTSWRYAVLESDAAPKDLWLKVLVQLPIPIAAIYDSGGNSIHALILINANSKAEWDRIVRGDLAELIVPLGSDLSAMTAIRLTRLPNCHRGETGKMQQLLYLNPNPDYTPIVDRPVHKGGD